MTAPTNLAPLPVVACWIGRDKWLYRSPWEVSDIPAVAVPLALFEDAEFRMAVMDRWTDDTATSMLDAIAAELRERAGRGVADA
jgi:hypothetical protein